MPVEDYMNDGGETAAETPSGENEETQGERALINASVCPGMKVGDTLELKVTAVRDGEYEVEYTPDSSENESENEAEAPPAGESGGMGAMMED